MYRKYICGGSKLRKKEQKKLKPKKTNILFEHFSNNIKEYVLVTIILLIGIFLGVLFINNTNDNQKTEITSYIENFISTIKNDNQIDKANLLKQSIFKNLRLSLILWFIGLSLIGIPIVFLIIAFRGFCIGYTVSAFIAILGTGKGILFTIITILIQNLILIPCILALGVSGTKLHKTLLRNKEKGNIKTEMYRHTFFCAIIAFAMCLSSFLEVYVSGNLIENFIKYI